MTTISGYARRPITAGMFADLTDAAMTIGFDHGRYSLTFDADLDVTTAAAIKARLESRNDTEPHSVSKPRRRTT